MFLSLDEGSTNGHQFRSLLSIRPANILHILDKGQFIELGNLSLSLSTNDGSGEEHQVRPRVRQSESGVMGKIIARNEVDGGRNKYYDA
jgi:hypothetical protein